MEGVGEINNSETRKTDILSLNLLSLSLTDAHGDLKTYEKNVHETMAGFPELRRKGLADFSSVFKLVDVKDSARARRRKVLAFFQANMTRENLHHASEVHESSHQCLILIDELRELMDRLISWMTMCLPANNHPLSVSHRQKLKLFQGVVIIVTQASIGFFSNARMLSWGSPTFPWKTTTAASRDSVIALPPSGMFFMRFDESPKSLPLEITRSLRRACSGARVWDDTAVRNYLVFLHLLPETPGARGGAAGAAKSDGLFGARDPSKHHPVHVPSKGRRR
ncbi:unnamed protein product [Ascophyllum nodosum]